MNGTVVNDCVIVSGASDCKWSGPDVSDCAKAGAWVWLIVRLSEGVPLGVCEWE